MFQRILVPLDGSPRAEHAIPVAARIARASGGSILLFRVVTHPIDAVASFIQPPDEVEDILNMRHARVADYLAHIAAHSDALNGVSTTTEIADSIPAQTILSTARLQAIDLIVMCSHGETGLTHWALGSVAQKVTRYSSVPVLVLPEKTPLESPFQGTNGVRMLIGLDGSAFAEAALEPAAHISAALSAPAPGAVHLTQVVRFPVQSIANIEPVISDEEAYLKSVEQRFREGTLAHLHLNVSSSVSVDTDVASTLLRIAENDLSSENESRDEMLALATHGRSGSQLWVLGSITERVLGTMKFPLLVVRPQPAEDVDVPMP